MNATFSLRVPQNMLDQLGQLAEVTGRSRNFLVLQAMQNFLQQEAWQVQGIVDAIKDMDEGKIATGAELAAMDKKWGQHGAED